MYERQAYSSGDASVFFGGLPLGSVGGGKGLIAQHTAAATGAGVVIQYGAAVSGLRRDDRGTSWASPTATSTDGEHDVDAGAVVLAAGGFEADPERRERHLGPGWSRALVRGTPSTRARSSTWPSRPARHASATGARATASRGTRARRRAAATES